jgi:hypothetical protein
MLYMKLRSIARVEGSPGAGGGFGGAASGGFGAPTNSGNSIGSQAKPAAPDMWKMRK